MSKEISAVDVAKPAAVRKMSREVAMNKTW